MIFQTDVTVRWNETDATLCARPSQLLVYMQETAFHHLDTAGQNFDTLRAERGLAFLLTRMTLRFYRPLRSMEKACVQTWVAPAHGINFPRFFRIQNEAGEVSAECASSWVLLDLSTRLPLRASAFTYQFTPEEPLPFATPRRFARPDIMSQVGTRRILYSDIDYTGHMNNTRYPDMVCDYLPQGIVPRIHTMHLDFVREAKYGSTLRVFCGEMRNEAGEPCYLVETRNEADEVCLCAQVLVKEVTA